MVQAGNLGIMQALYDYNGQSSLSTWIYNKVRHELQKQREVEHPIKISRYLLKKGCSATYQDSVDLIDNRLPSTLVENNENIELLTDALRHIQRKYTKIQCKIFADYYYLSIPLNKLARKYKTNAEYVIKNIINELRRYTNVYT